MFVGHVSIDQVENLRGVRVYAAMAAKTLLKEIALVSVVGKDFKFTNVLSLVDSEHVRTSSMPSTRFNIKYNKRGETQYLNATCGAGSRIAASSIPTKLLTAESIVHLSPMAPTKVAKIFEKIRKDSPKTRISINTWINYIVKSRKNRATLKNLALKADFFMLNDAEAKALAQTDIGMQMIPALNVPLKNVVDTTGAGDTWCGAFIAAYKLTEDLMKSITIASIISSIKCSGWGLKKLVNLQFRKPDDVIEYVIGLKEGALQKRILDYTKR